MANDNYPPTTKPTIPGTQMNGWGADKNPADRPAVPKEAPSNVTTVRGIVPPRMTPNVKIHMSIEHPDLTPVFGTSCPPRGISGRLRDFAYQFGEGRLAHWMTLLLADRIDVLEGRVEDLSHGQLPHPLKERGFTSGSAASNNRQRQIALIAGASLGILALGAVMTTTRTARTPKGKARKGAKRKR